MNRGNPILPRGHCVPTPTGAKRLRGLVQDFLRRRGDEIDGSVALTAAQPNIESAIETAVFAKHPEYKKHPHQFRLTHHSMRQTCQALLRHARQIASAKSFNEIHHLVKDCAAHEFGELATYDTAHRLGAYLKIEPDMVYLHCGTRWGAKALGLDISRGVLRLRELPDELRSLHASQIEDFLCIYKDHLRIAKPSGSVLPGSRKARC